MHNLPDSIPQRIHFSGIGGAGMSGLALALHEVGRSISGSDREATPVSRALIDRGIAVTLDQSGAFSSPLPQLLVRTAAMPLDHPEIQSATRAGIPIIKRSELLGLLSQREHSIAVAGTHGKTTVCAMLATMLKNSGGDPGWFVGAQLDALPQGHLGGDATLVIEADEYDRSFLTLHPRHLIVTRLDWDHVDIYPTPQDLYTAMDELASRPTHGSIVLQCHTDPAELAWVPRNAQSPVCTVGRHSRCDWILEGDQGQCRLRHRDSGRSLPPFTPPLPGEHNRLNAACCLVWCALQQEALSLNLEELALALQNFSGLQRRFQTLWHKGSRMLLDDYAHHPSEIAACLQAASELPHERITVIHQPHTFSRVKAFSRETAEALSLADRVYTWPVFAAREQPLKGVTHRSFLPFMSDHPHAKAVDNLQDLLSDLLPIQPGELIITVGAGDLYKIHAQLIAALESSLEL